MPAATPQDVALDRLVPVHPTTLVVLRQYARSRDRVPP